LVVKFPETDEGRKKKRTAMQRHRCFWIEGRGSRMIFGIINNAKNGDKDVAKMHIEREMEEKKLRKTRARLHI